MIRAWLRYLLLLVFASALYIFYVGYISYFIFLCMLSLPILSFLLYCIAAWRFELYVHCETRQLYKGETQEIHIRSRTRVWVPLAKVEAKVHTENHFHNTSTKEAVFFTSEHRYTDVVIPCECTMCGKYTIHIESVYIYDILHMWKKKKRCTSTLDFYVLPSPSQMQEELMVAPQLGDEAFDLYRAGNDPSETFDVHEYRSGDALTKIHWKLSAKLDTLMVREASMPIAKHVKIYFDLYGSSLDADTILAQIFGCSLQLLSNQHEHDIFQFEAGACIYEKHITSKADIIAYLCSILSKRASMSETSSLEDISFAQDTILIQKNRVISHTKRR